jgi:DNA-binding MarR family transcriptional regulator
VGTKSYDRCNLLAVRQAARQTTQFYEGYFNAIGLRATQFGILDRLDQSEPISIRELAEALVMDQATMGRAVQPLQRDGYLSIGPGRDGRTRGLRLTTAGAAKLGEAWGAWREATAAFEARAGGGVASAALRNTLSRIVGALGDR